MSGTDSFGTPLAYQDPALLARGLGGPITKILFPDTVAMFTAGRIFQEQAFAAVWWLPVLLVLLLLPVWFRQLGVGPGVSLPLTLIVVMSPVSVWWSWGVMVCLGWALLAAVAAEAGVRAWGFRGPSWHSLLLLIVSGGALARLALSYQPWAVPLGASVLIPMLAALVAAPGQRLRNLLLAGASLAIGLLLLGAYLLEHHAGVSVLADTVYPGSRRFSGQLVSTAALFAAPHLWILQKGAPLAGTNQSEITSGYLTLGLVAVALIPAIDWRRASVLRVPTLSSVFVLLALTSWCTIDWPLTATHLFPINLVSPGRLVQVLGVSATLTLGLVLGAWIRAPLGRRVPTALTGAILVLFATAAGGSAFRAAHLPQLRAISVGVVAILAAVAIGLAVAYAGRRWALMPLAALAIPVVVFVNPLQLGFADLRSGSAASEIAAATEDLRLGERWASDDVYADALLMANAAPSVSGQQWGGPDESEWRKLDPTDAYRPVWNRGASYVVFAWADAGTRTSIELPSPDMIVVHTDPCDVALHRLHITMLMSSRKLDESCLSQRARLTIGGQAHWVYARMS